MSDSDGHFINDAGLQDILGDIKGAHVENSAPDQPQIQQNPPAFEKTGIFDVDGIEFDPAIHSHDAHNNPTRTKLGRFRKKKNAGQPQHQHQQRINIPEGFSTEEYSPAAHAAAAMYIQTGVVIFGPEWLPEKEKAEHTTLTAAFDEYFRHKGIEDFPPGVALAIAMIGYAAPRLYKPQTQSKIAIALSWLQYKAAGLIFWRKKQNGARNDLGANGMRQDNTGKTSDTRRASWWRPSARS